VKLFGDVGRGQRTNRLDFGGDPRTTMSIRVFLKDKQQIELKMYSPGGRTTLGEGWWSPSPSI